VDEDKLPPGRGRAVCLTLMMDRAIKSRADLKTFNLDVRYYIISCLFTTSKQINQRGPGKSRLAHKPARGLLPTSQTHSGISLAASRSTGIPPPMESSATGCGTGKEQAKKASAIAVPGWPKFRIRSFQGQGSRTGRKLGKIVGENLAPNGLQIRHPTRKSQKTHGLRWSRRDCYSTGRSCPSDQRRQFSSEH
jgi:hypothetical protein